jgi:hypothetical protein
MNEEISLLGVLRVLRERKRERKRERLRDRERERETVSISGRTYTRGAGRGERGPGADVHTLIYLSESWEGK